jgi:hypothetical protein
MAERRADIKFLIFEEGPMRLILSLFFAFLAILLFILAVPGFCDTFSSYYSQAENSTSYPEKARLLTLAVQNWTNADGTQALAKTYNLLGMSDTYLKYYRLAAIYTQLKMVCEI